MRVKVHAVLRATCLAAVLSCTACGTPGVVFHQTRTAPGYAATVQRLLVVHNLPEAFRAEGSDPIFADALANAFRRCGVTAEVFRTGSLRSSNLRYDATLDIIRVRAMAGSVTDETYVGTLTDRTTGREVWKAEFGFAYGLNRPRTSFPPLAADFVNRMARDGVIRSCPAPAG